MCSRVALYSGEPGGAEVLASVFEVLAREPSFQARVIAGGRAVDRFARRGVAAVAAYGPEEVLVLLDRWRPGLVISSATSLAARDPTEGAIWRHCRSRGISSLAWLDQWQNYAARFFPDGRVGDPALLPDHINAINDLGIAEMVAEGFPRERLVAFGHPYLGGLARAVEAVDREAARAALGVAGTANLALFVSEPIREHFGNARGYSEVEAIRGWLKWMARRDDAAVAVLKAHPKDDRVAIERLTTSAAQAEVRVVGEEVTPHECVVAADEVYGMSSVMLIEAYLLGKPVLSFQPDLEGPDPFVLTRHGLVNLATTTGELRIPLCARPGEKPFDIAFDQCGFVQFVARRLAGGGIQDVAE